MTDQPADDQTAVPPADEPAAPAPRQPRVEYNRNPRRDSERLSSVTTAIHLLKTFSNEDQELGVSELAKRLLVAKSTVHRLASALVEEGLLQQNPENGRYRLGIALFTLGSQVRARLDVNNEARRVLYELRDRTGENARLAVLERSNVVLLHDLESAQTLRLKSGTGQLRPAFCTAEGFCLLSGLREAELARLLLFPRARRTDRTQTDEEAIRARLRGVRRNGYAIEDEECDDGTRCVAAPVYNAEGRIIAAIGIAGPRQRVRKGQFPALGATVMAAAAEVSRRIGYRAAGGITGGFSGGSAV